MYSSFRYIKPSEIRFTQESIPNHFGGQSKVSCNQVIEEIIGGRLSPNTLPPIRVIEWDNKLYTQDNRKLYILRTAEYYGALKEIKVLDEGIRNVKWVDEFTTENDGRQIYIRGDVTKEHYKPNWLLENRNRQIQAKEVGHSSYVVIDTDDQDEPECAVHNGSSLCPHVKEDVPISWYNSTNPDEWIHECSFHHPEQVKRKDIVRTRYAGCCECCECGNCCICNSMVLCLLNLVMIIMVILGFVYLIKH